MIDHTAARRAGATAIDFDLDSDERAGLDEHLRSCAACRAFMAGLATDTSGLRSLDLGPVPMTVRANVAIVAERRKRGGRSGPVLLAAAALLMVAILGGAALGVGGRPGGTDGDPDAAPPVGRAVHWTTEVVELTADDLWLEVGGQVVVPPEDREIKVHSDPGTDRYWTLEVAWNAGQVEMRINLYFSADDATWRIDEARIYDGRVPGDWLETSEVPVRAPIGAGFSGDVDLTLQDRSGPDTGPGRLIMRGLRLATRAGGDIAPVGKDPLDLLPPGIDAAPFAVPAMKVDCGPLDPQACHALVRTATGDAARIHPNQTVVGVIVESDGLGWFVLLDDGSVISMAGPGGG